MNTKAIKTLLALLLEEDEPQTAKTPLTGQHIAVLDRGFVYVGNVADEGEYLRVTDCKNIRVWGHQERARRAGQRPAKRDETGPVRANLGPEAGAHPPCAVQGFLI